MAHVEVEIFPKGDPRNKSRIEWLEVIGLDAATVVAPQVAHYNDERHTVTLYAYARDALGRLFCGCAVQGYDRSAHRRHEIVSTLVTAPASVSPFALA